MCYKRIYADCSNQQSMYKERVKNLLNVVMIVMATKEHLKCTAWHVQ